MYATPGATCTLLSSPVQNGRVNISRSLNISVCRLSSRSKLPEPRLCSVNFIADARHNPRADKPARPCHFAGEKKLWRTIERTIGRASLTTSHFTIAPRNYQLYVRRIHARESSNTAGKERP